MYSHQDLVRGPHGSHVVVRADGARDGGQIRQELRLNLFRRPVGPDDARPGIDPPGRLQGQMQEDGPPGGKRLPGVGFRVSAQGQDGDGQLGGQSQELFGSRQFTHVVEDDRHPRPRPWFRSWP